MDLVGIKCGVLADRVAALIELEDRPLDMAAATLREQTNPLHAMRRADEARRQTTRRAGRLAEMCADVQNRAIELIPHAEKRGVPSPCLHAFAVGGTKCFEIEGSPAQFRQELLAIIAAKSPDDADLLWANARWIDAKCTVNPENLRKRVERNKDIRTRKKSARSHPEYCLQDVERAFPSKAAGLVKKFLAE